MFMLPLHLCLLCDIINTHLFESYPKTDKIHVEGSHVVTTPLAITKATTISTRKIKRPYLRDGSFFITYLYSALRQTTKGLYCREAS